MSAANPPQVDSGLAGPLAPRAALPVQSRPEIGLVTTRSPGARAHRRGILAWSLYDFANSAFVTSMVTAIFSIYFAKFLVEGGEARVLGRIVPGDALWSFTVAFSVAVVTLPAPILGSLADASGARKRFLLGFWLLGVAATAALWWAVPGRWLYAAVAFALANIGFSGGNVFYNALLRDVAREDELDRVSGLGYALGYIGGGLSLAAGVALLSIRREDPVPAFRADCVLIALWWLVFGVPIFVWVEERRGRPVPTARVREAFRRLARTFRSVRRLPQLWKLWLAHLLYNDAITTTIAMAAVYGERTLGMPPERLALCLLLVQFVAFGGSLGFVALSRRVREKRALLAALVGWTVALVWAYLLRSEWQYWVLAAGVGLILGGTQALSRSLFARLAPASDSAEFFGFFAYSEKISAVTGPIVYGWVSMHGGPRAAILALGGLLLAGMALLALVRVDEGVADASAMDGSPAGEGPAPGKPSPAGGG